MKDSLSYLDELEAKSIYIIREAYRNFKDRIAALVSFGKDSTTMLYLMNSSEKSLEHFLRVQ